MAFPVKCPWLSVNLLAKVRRSSCLLSRFNFLVKVRRSCLLCEGLAYLQLNFLGTSNFINWWRLARHFWYFLASFYTSGTPRARCKPPPCKRFKNFVWYLTVTGNQGTESTAKILSCHLLLYFTNSRSCVTCG